jgi:hypothetical protein
MTFAKGRQKTGGRKTGQSVNKIPKLIKDCVILAAELEGMDNKGKDGMVGFLRRVAREDITAYAGLLKAVMGQQGEGDKDVRVEVVYETVEDMRRELASRGIDMDVMAQILLDPPTENVIDHESPAA